MSKILAGMEWLANTSLSNNFPLQKLFKGVKNKYILMLKITCIYHWHDKML